MIETWKPISGYEGIYEVSDQGRVKRIKDDDATYNGKILAGGEDLDGYRVLLLYKDGKRRMYKEHRLVASAFLPNPRNLPQVNHKNAIKSDNRADNLEWCSCKHNINHAVDKGLWNPSKGENHHHAKLSESQVLEIRDLLSNGKSPQEIAPSFGVNATTVYDIRAGRTWKQSQ